MKRWLVLALVVAAPVFAPGDARADGSSPISSDDERPLWAVGARADLLLVPGWMMSPFLDHYTTLTSGALALEVTHRKGSFDVVGSLGLGFYGFPDGNFLGAGKDPSLDSHYVQFQNLDLVSLNVLFVWHKEMASWAEAFVGAGLGLGIVTGDIWVINNSSSVCHGDVPAMNGMPAMASNTADPSKCYPISGDTYVNAQGQTVPIKTIQPGDPDFQRKLEGTTAAQAKCMLTATNDCRDTADHPYFHPAQEKPPLVPIIHVVLGVRFKIHRHFNLNVSGGFRDGWVLSLGPEVVF